MRIAVNTRFLLEGKMEGVGRFTFEVLKKMVRAHPEHEFLFLFDRPYDEQFIFSDNITPVVVSPPARHPILFYIWFEWSIPRVLKKLQADVFLSTDNFCSLRSSVPTTLVIHDIAYRHFPEQISVAQRWFYRYFTPKYVAKANRIVAVSQYTKSDIINEFGCEGDKISVACNGASPDFRPLKENEKDDVKLKYSDGADYFVYIGAIHPRKNVHRIIRAFSQFKTNTKSPVKLLLIGRFAWKTGAVLKAYNESEYKDDIIFLGFIKHIEVTKILAASCGLVYTSLFEGFGIPILEAMHCEVPVITSNVTSMPEVAGDAAILVDPKNVIGVANAMKNLCESKEITSYLVNKGKVQREKFSWDKAAEVVYRNVAESVER